MDTNQPTTIFIVIFLIAVKSPFVICIKGFKLVLQGLLQYFTFNKEHGIPRSNYITDGIAAVLKHLLVTWVAKKFPVFYGIWSFIAAFTVATQWFLSIAKLVQYIIFQAI